MKKGTSAIKTHVMQCSKRVVLNKEREREKPKLNYVT